MQKLGFIGLGVMGLRMSRRLIDSGYDLLVYDLDPKPFEELVALGAKGLSSPAEVAAESDVLISMLPTPAITREVMLGKGGAAAGLREGSIFIDMSTSDPLLSKEIYTVLQQRKVEMLDAPVSGGMEGASAGTLSIMVGGNEQALEKVKHILNCMGKKVARVGPVGAGHTIKLINNMLFATIMAATSEALVFGQKNGVELSVLRDVINSSSGRSYAMDVKVRDFILPRDFTPGFSVDLQVKDVDLALQLAKDMGVPLILTTLVRQAYQTILLKGYGKKDTSVIISFFEELMGATERV
jgi:2-hydroxymethylglutarate dehydrogenase